MLLCYFWSGGGLSGGTGTSKTLSVIEMKA
jgi:hypothetical protein